RICACEPCPAEVLVKSSPGRHRLLGAAHARDPSNLSGHGIPASPLLLFLERKNIGRLVTGGRRQLGDARREIKGDALSADPEDETLRFLIGCDLPAVVFLDGYNFWCFRHMQNIGRWHRTLATGP